MKQKLQEILVCPKCKGALILEKNPEQLRCKIDRLSFPIREGIPVLLLSEAQAT